MRRIVRQKDTKRNKVRQKDDKMREKASLRNGTKKEDVFCCFL